MLRAMNHRSRNVFAAGALLVLCTHPRAAAPEPFEFRIAAGKAEEVCVALAKGEGFDFSFRADAPVDFNVHYHVGRKVVTPIDVRRVMRQTGRVVAKTKREHCMMWGAKHGEAGVIGRWEPLAAKP